MRIDNPYLVGKMLKSISPDSVRSGRTCPANLGVRSCPVRKLICPVRSSPNIKDSRVYLFMRGEIQYTLFLYGLI
jgi:hypothetical protein